MFAGVGRKIIALVSSFVLASTLVPAAAFAAGSGSSATTNYHDDFSKIETLNDDSILGLDFSQYQKDITEWHKGGFFNYRYEGVDAFKFVKSQGVNTVSVKVLVDASKASSDANKSFTLENAAKTVKAANAAGLKTNVVLCYSNDVTSKDDQSVPSGWDEDIDETLDGEADGSATNVIRHASKYTKDVISYLKEKSATPTMITIGNEVNYNFLSYSGEDEGWHGWFAMRYLANVVKEAGIKVGFSFAADGSASGIQWPLAKINDSWIKCDYDYVGINYYPSSDSEAKEYLSEALSTFEETQKAADRSGTQFYLSNFKAPRKAGDSSASEETQARSIYAMLKATSDKTNAGGLVVQDGAAIGSWNSFFEEDHALTSLATFAYAQGSKVDVTSTPTEDAIYKYGLDYDLKDQSVNISQISNMNSSAVRGVDISSYYALKKAGVKFRDNNGKECSLLKVLADNGVNYVRLRIWNDPYNAKGEVYGGGDCSVNNMLEVAKEASQYNMKILLCFHYSDFWASPAVQQLPKAWKKDASKPKSIANDIYKFTKETTKKFVDAGCNVGMVQIGNEISRGVAGTHAASYKKLWGNKTNAKNACSYLKAGSKAVREVAPKALVALHIETPSYAKYNYICNVWKSYGIDYDVLGTSCYAFWNQTTDALTQAQSVATKYGKLFCILETSWLNTLQDADGTTNQLGAGTASLTYKVGVQGQVNLLTDQYKTVLSKANGLGAFYWEPAWIPVKAGWVNWQYNKDIANKLGTGWASDGAVGYHPNSKLYYQGKLITGGSGWDNQALFDFKGNPLKSLGFYKKSQVSNETQTVRIKLCDKSGKSIASDVYARVKASGTTTITLPKVNGFKRSSYKLTITGTGTNLVTKKVKYSPTIYAKTKSSSYTYSGKKKKPKVDIYYGSKRIAKSLKKSTSKYKLTYKTGKKVGSYSVKVKVKKGKYKGLKSTATFTIKPKKAKITKLTVGKGQIKVKWKKISAQCSGYQLAYSTKGSFVDISKNTIKLSSAKSTSKTIKKLTSGKKYYVKVRTYKVEKGKTYYGAWSTVKNATTK